MRKTTEHVIAAAVTLVTLAGCGSDDIGPDAGVGKDSPDFTATIGGASTRAFDSSWEAGDEIGISGGIRTNVCYLTKDGDGLFTVKTPGDEIYFQDDSEVTFTAYYPWHSLAGEASAKSTLTHGRRPGRRSLTFSGRRPPERKRLQKWLSHSRTVWRKWC